MNNQGYILIVDDSPVNSRFLVNLLKERGYQVHSVNSGQLALSAVYDFPIDLILLDIIMPDLDGYKVCEKLKSDEKTQQIPVIFISAIDEVLDKVKAFTVGGVDFLTKPVQPEEMIARIETHLQIRRLQNNLQEKNEKLAATLKQLQKAQSQLVQSEKMAALGQLVAGISHEINTPLGAIRSSIENIADFFDKSQENLRNLCTIISSTEQDLFFNLLSHYQQSNKSLSSREKRQLRREVIRTLEAENIEKADLIADTLVDLGISGDNLPPFIPLFKQSDGINLLNEAYHFFSLRKSAETIQIATDRAAKIVFALKSYARYDSGTEKMRADIIHGIETVLTLYHNQIKKGVKVIKNYANLPLILCYPDELTQVWTNLIHNSLQAMEYQGELIIDVQQDNSQVLIKITDSGSGMSEEIISRIYEPFFTTKPPGEGSGLGLDIVKRIIEKHEGKIEVDSKIGQTTFTVFIPIVP